MRRKCEIVEVMEILASNTPTQNAAYLQHILENISIAHDGISASTPFGMPVKIYTCAEKEFAQKLFETTGTAEHLKFVETRFIDSPSDVARNNHPASEQEIYISAGLPWIEPELREGLFEEQLLKDKNAIPRLVELSDLKGILHNHTKYSDGIHTLAEMAAYCKELGYEYLGICDHSKSAQYAGGLLPEKVLEQQKEIDALNQKMHPFRIFKGIESDILSDGSLDYDESILRTFDFIVASVHSNLKMDEEKATARILKAVENPYTTILGHPTGRLLLSRPGYPLDHKKIIDACAANGVVIELNAHPYRLDLDWRWIPYALEKGVKISINPDAHNKEGYRDMHYGICVARKGALTKEMTFNALTREEIEKYFLMRKKGFR
jgi:DNA polymerase (family 10)